MASIKLAYLGGGSTRAPGTMAAFIHNHGASFAGSEVVLIDLFPERLAIVEQLARRMAEVRGLDIRFRCTTDRRAGLTDVDAVLSSYRPGGFEARVLDERIPLRHGVIGQETQGPGGFFMALRSIHVLQGLLADLEQVAPGARIFNYTNPVNIVAQAATLHSDDPLHVLLRRHLRLPAGAGRRRWARSIAHLRAHDRPQPHHLERRDGRTTVPTPCPPSRPPGNRCCASPTWTRTTGDSSSWQ